MLPVLELYLPAAQAVQEDAPLLLHVPAGQLAHSALPCSLQLVLPQIPITQVLQHSQFKVLEER